jgi:hypothetical protein
VCGPCGRALLKSSIEVVSFFQLSDRRRRLRDELAGRRSAAGFGPGECVLETIKGSLAPPLSNGRAGVDARQRDLVEVARSERITALIELEAQLLAGEQGAGGLVLHVG